MTVKTHGIVLAQTPLSSQDKRLTLLTSDLGLVDAIARNVSGARSKLSAAAEVLAYNDFCLFKGKSGYIVNSADLENNFYGLREDLVNLSLAGYFCELTRFVLPSEDNGGEILRLLLNTLYLLEKKKRTPTFLKPIYELRLLSLSGFAPNLQDCCICGEVGQKEVYFLPVEGRLICGDCLLKHPYDQLKIILPDAVRKAMEYILNADIRQLFAFQLTSDSEKLLEAVSEAFTLCHAGSKFKSLEFYKSITI